MKHIKVFFVSLTLLTLSLTACNQEPVNNQPDPAQLREKLIEHNQKKIRTEDKIIDDYVLLHYPDAGKTSTGLRYVIYPLGSDKLATKNQVATIDYSVELLNGQSVYSTKKKGGPEKFRITHEDAPDGLHEGLQLLHLGDSAVFIMPSHLAYGFTGDQESIGQNAILVYKVVLIELE